MLIEKIKSIFDIEVVTTRQFKRSDDDSVINLFLTDKNGKEYFLKEIQEHSMREGFDELYKNLSEVKTDRFQMILPISYINVANKFLFESDSKNFLLFNKENFKPFDKNKYNWETLLDDLLFFQELIKSKTFTKQDFRTYESWINVGLSRFNRNFGETPAFVTKFEKFMRERFPKIEFESGNIHWDVHVDNLGMDENGKLVLMDFDLVQTGYKIHDLLGAVGMYVDWSKARSESPEKFFKEVFAKLSPYAKGMELSDMKFLLIRGVLGELALKTKEEAFEKLSGYSFI